MRPITKIRASFYISISALLVAAAFCPASAALLQPIQMICDPAQTGVSCINQLCDQTKLGVTTMDGDGKNIIACLKTDEPNISRWKGMSNGGKNCSAVYPTHNMGGNTTFNSTTVPHGQIGKFTESSYQAVYGSVMVDQCWDGKVITYALPILMPEGDHGDGGDH